MRRQLQIFADYLQILNLEHFNIPGLVALSHLPQAFYIAKLQKLKPQKYSRNTKLKANFC